MPDNGHRVDGYREPADGADGVPPHMARIFTRNADEHHAWIAVRYDDHTRKVGPCRRGFEFFATSGELGGVTVARTYYWAATAEVAWPPVPYAIAGRLLSDRGEPADHWPGRTRNCWPRSRATAPRSPRSRHGGGMPARTSSPPPTARRTASHPLKRCAHEQPT